MPLYPFRPLLRDPRPRALAARSAASAAVRELRGWLQRRVRPRPLLPRLALLALALAGALAGTPVQASDTLAVRRLDWSFVAPDPQAPADASGESHSTFGLPLHWSTVEDTPLRTVALRLAFPLAQVPDQTWALLLTRSSEGGRFSVNGHFIGTIAAESAYRHVAWHRPLLLSIDPSLLVAGDNQVLIETSYGPGEHTLSGVEIGPMATLWNQFAVRFFLEILWTWSGATLALVTALVFGALWYQRREAVSLLLALAAACWLVYSAQYLAEIMPQSLRVGVRLAGMTAQAAFMALVAITLLRLSALARRREEWLIGIYAALGPMLAMATALRAAPYLELSWEPGLRLIVGAALGVGLYRRTRGQAAPHPLVLVAAMVLVLAALIDFGALIGLARWENTPLLNFAGPLMLAALATPLVDGFIRMMQEAETARVELETRVREREQLLKRNFERLRESERVKVEVQERQRIMQDMHDGLGSQLMSSLMLVEREAVSNDQFAQILRESIDDMRLAIDALAADDADLAAALGNLRFRMEPRLRAAGMELTWDARRLPEEIGLHQDVVLPILRIVQEALTNALKHSRAKAVRVTLGVEGAGELQALDILVSDNGRGISEERVGGRGLLNMRNRAQKIGAQLKIESAPNAGTTVHLRTRVGPIGTGARAQQTVLNTQAVIERARQE